MLESSPTGDLEPKKDYLFRKWFPPVGEMTENGPRKYLAWYREVDKLLPRVRFFACDDNITGASYETYVTPGDTIERDDKIFTHLQKMDLNLTSWTFKGWRVRSTSPNQIEYGEPITGDVDYSAMWEIDRYKAPGQIFNYNDGDTMRISYSFGDISSILPPSGYIRLVHYDGTVHHKCGGDPERNCVYFTAYLGETQNSNLYNTSSNLLAISDKQRLMLTSQEMDTYLHKELEFNGDYVYYPFGSDRKYLVFDVVRDSTCHHGWSFSNATVLLQYY